LCKFEDLNYRNISVQTPENTIEYLINYKQTDVEYKYYDWNEGNSGNTYESIQEYIDSQSGDTMQFDCEDNSCAYLKLENNKVIEKDGDNEVEIGTWSIVLASNDVPEHIAVKYVSSEIDNKYNEHGDEVRIVALGKDKEIHTAEKKILMENQFSVYSKEILPAVKEAFENAYTVLNIVPEYYNTQTEEVCESVTFPDNLKLYMQGNDVPSIESSVDTNGSATVYLLKEVYVDGLTPNYMSLKDDYNTVSSGYNQTNNQIRINSCNLTE